MAEDRQKITIRSEADAFNYLQRALQDEFQDRPVLIKFQNWPILTIKLEGRGYNSTITPDMANALVSLQHAINRTYARVVKDESTSRSLSDEERSELQFKAKVKKGSSLIEVNLGQLIEKIGLSAVQKMDPMLIATVIVGLGVVTGSVLAYRYYLNHKSEGKKVEEETKRSVQLSQEETKRLEIMASVVAQSPVVGHVLEDFDGVRQDVLKGVADAKSLTVQGVKIQGVDARSIARAPRDEADEKQLNGQYKICKIDWDKVDVARLWLEGAENGRRFIATLKVDEMDAKKRDLLQEAEWGRRTVYLSINAREVRGEVTRAVIVNADWPEEE